MLPSLNTVADQQSNPTNNTESAITKLIDYSATNPSTRIQYKSSNMILYFESDASYLSEPRVIRRTEG